MRKRKREGEKGSKEGDRVKGRREEGRRERRKKKNKGRKNQDYHLLVWRFSFTSGQREEVLIVGFL